jgi:hypothetical protein
VWFGKTVSSAVAAERMQSKRNNRSGWRNALADYLFAARATEIQLDLVPADRAAILKEEIKSVFKEFLSAFVRYF